ncbi:hypothetical protein C8R42DRAFT_27144 [Lentinula raphanica]|nr:hypothetical protein C8R42DRAFT_27144 [Lentinula raphanica]
MRIINTFLPLVTLAVHVAGLYIPGDRGSLYKRSDLGSARAIERRGPFTIDSRSGDSDPTPAGFGPSIGDGDSDSYHSGESDPVHHGFGPSTANTAERRSGTSDPTPDGFGPSTGDEDSYNSGDSDPRPSGFGPSKVERRAQSDPHPEGHGGSPGGSNQHPGSDPAPSGRGPHSGNSVVAPRDSGLSLDNAICHTNPNSPGCLRKRDIAKHRYRRRIDSWSELENLD